MTDPQPSALRLADQPNPFADAEDARELLGQLAGAASMCWIPRPGEQVFDSEQAGRFVEYAVHRLEELQRTGDSSYYIADGHHYCAECNARLAHGHAPGCSLMART